MFEPIKVGFGQYMVGFYNSLVPTTQSMPEFIGRGAAKAMAFAPSRMVDAAEEMLASWQRNDTDSSDTRPAKLPAVLVAMAQDYVPTGRDYTRQIADSMPTIIPADAKARAFGLRTVAGDIRAQILIVAADEPTARSIASQFHLFLDAVPNRRFHYSHTFAGATTDWPVQIEAPDSPAIAIKTDVKNIVMLAIDLILKAQIPLYDAPAVGQPNDGKGIPGTDDPAGYPLVNQVNFDDKTLNKQDVVI